MYHSTVQKNTQQQKLLQQRFEKERKRKDFPQFYYHINPKTTKQKLWVGLMVIYIDILSPFQIWHISIYQTILAMFLQNVNYPSKNCFTRLMRTSYQLIHFNMLEKFVCFNESYLNQRNKSMKKYSKDLIWKRWNQACV